MNQLILQILEQSVECIISISKFQSSDLSVIKNSDVDTTLNDISINSLSIMTYKDKEYPQHLLDTDGPALLFYKGDISLINQTSFAIVGSRSLDKYSLTLMQSIIPRIDEPILSGFAIGVDIEAHKLAIINNSKCIAVLPCGLKQSAITPKTNIEYISKIIESGGLIVSQFIPNHTPKRYSYILRNELIASLCSKIWIVKAALKSGTISTANYAFKFDKTIYTTINNIFDEDYKGNAFVLQNGGIPITALDQFGKAKTKKTYTPNQQDLINLVKSGISNVEILTERLGYPVYTKTYMELSLQKVIYEDEGSLFLVD
jgi:DNA processing protein